MNTDEQNFLITGKIISLTREVESRMAECGASGNGLREKAESLGSKLPPEAVKLSIYIGNIRNKLAHESTPQISDAELALFEESAQTLLDFLDRLKTPSPASPAEKFPAPQKTAETTAAEAPAAPPPRFQTNHFAFLPLGHLLFGAELFWRSFCRGWEYLILLAAELFALFAISYTSWNRTLNAWFGAGIALLVFCWLISIWDKLRRSDISLCGKLALFPLSNAAYFSVCLWENFVPFYFIAALVIYGSMAGGIHFLLQHEWQFAAICGGISYLVSIITGLLTRGEKSE